MINNYLAYVTLSLTVCASPGPAVVLTIKNSLKYGSKTAMATILGNFIALAILATISAVGLGAVMHTSPLVFSVLKTLGCLYLLYLGTEVWRSPSDTEIFTEEEPDRDLQRKRAWLVFKEGFGVGLLNPKAITFFTALFPQFVDGSRAFFPQFATLILTVEGISCTTLVVYALASSYIARHLMNEKSITLVNRITGASLILFGLSLLFLH